MRVQPIVFCSSVKMADFPVFTEIREYKSLIKLAPGVILESDDEIRKSTYLLSQIEQGVNLRSCLDNRTYFVSGFRIIRVLKSRSR